METLATFLYVIFNTIGTVGTVVAWLLIVVGPAFLLGTTIYKLAIMPKTQIATRKGSSRMEIEARARIFEQQLKHRNNIR